MALIKMGSVVAEVSGSLDGVTFSHNRNGRYARARVKPTNPRSVRQSNVRGNLATLSQQWRTLTTAQRTGWTNLGSQMQQMNRLGAMYTLTGQQAFISVNQLRLTSGQAVVTDAPIMDSAPTVSITSATATFTTTGSVTTVTLAYTTNGTATQRLRFYSTGPMSAGKQFIRKSQYRLLQTNNANAGTPATLTASYTSTYGPLNAAMAGARISFQIIPVSANGIAGPPQRVDAIVTII